MRLYKVTEQDVQQFKEDTEMLFSAWTVSGARAKFYVKLDGGYRIVSGEAVEYEGDSLEAAVETWNCL